MYFKSFTRLFLLIGMIGLLSAPFRAEEIQILGTGTQTDANLPTHSYYNYSMTQQIYTAEEIENAGGGVGTINSIAFYNGGSTKSRSFDIYLVNTNKESFDNNSDWITVAASDLVFSGSVEMTANTWKTITFSSPFAYNGGNLAVVVDDNTGKYESGVSCRVFSASSTQSIYYRNDNNNPNPTNPTITGIPTTLKNQIILDIETSAVTCAKPKNFNAESITAHTATLTWTAGTEDQSNWDVYVTVTANDIPDENTIPTYQVTVCSKALTGLTAQTAYYAYVRANCGSGDKSKWVNKTFTTTREALTVDANNPYLQDFESGNDWGFTNGNLTNQWCWGSATNNGGAKAMYVSKDEGTTYEYAHGNTVIYASKLFDFSQGTYTFVFDWQANGEKSGSTHYDYMRAALVPGDMDFTAGTTLPTGLSYSALPSSWIALDGGHQLNLTTDWQTQTAEATVSGTYTMVFVWRNDGSGGNQPPAAIDNISISFMNCPRPTGLTASNIGGRTATLTWTENGTATNWVLQYATNNGFSENLVETNVSGTATKELTGLSPETTYYARVKSVLGNQESSWSDVEDFTTTATCEKPTLSYVSNSNTAHTGTVSWTGSAENYELIYSTNYSFEPGDEDVVQINLGSVNTYTLQDLAPETTYRIKVRANCGAEDGYSQWSNQVSFTTTATCVKPTGLAASNVTSATATISWTAGQTEQNAWNLEYKKSSESDWQSVAVTTTSYNLSNLSPVTTYNIRVQADCGDGDLSQWTTNTFTTSCGAIDLPYTCDFEGTLQTVNSCKIPSCWSVIRGYYNNTYSYGIPTVANQSSSTQPIAYPHGGSYALYFLNSTYSGTSPEYAILPELGSRYGIREVQITFWGRSQNSETTVQVGVMTDPGDASTFVKVADVALSSTYSEKIVLFDTYSGNGRYIAFCCPAATSYSQAFYIDDILLESNISCSVPTELEAIVNSATQTTLTWHPNGSENAWELVINAEGNSVAQTIAVTDDPTYTFTTVPATTYQARVRSDCSGGDYSDWTDDISFTSDCGITTVDVNHPFIEDFNNDVFPSDCWQKVNFNEMGSTEGWHRNTNNALDNQGAITSDFKHETWLFLPVLHIDGDVSLSFDNLFSDGAVYATSSIMVSTNPDFDVHDILTEGFIGTHFTTIWTADETNLPSTKRNETVSLSNFDGQDIYVAFRYEGNNSNSQRVWWIDNVKLYVIANQTVNLASGWNWFSTNLDITLEELKTALVDAAGSAPIRIYSQGNGNLTYNGNSWRGNMTWDLTQMYKIQIETLNSVVMVLEGVVINPANYPVTIKNGANYIAFPFTMNINLVEVFDGFAQIGDRIVSIMNGQSTYNGNTWRNPYLLEPGQGYIYYSSDVEDRILVFPSR